MTRYMDYAGGDEEFAEWLKAVDGYCIRAFFLSIFDMPDYLWRDAFDDGLTPKQAWRQFAEDEGLV